MIIKMFTKLFLITVVSLVASEKVRYDNYSLYKIVPENEDQLEFMKSLLKDGEGLDFWYPPTRVGDFISVVSSPEVKEDFEYSLKEHKISANIVLENIQGQLDEENKSRRKRSLIEEGVLFWDAYQTYDQIVSWFHRLEKENPDTVTVIHAGHTYEGRNITGIKISRGAGRRAFFLEGGQVGADWLSPTVVTYIADQLIHSNDSEAVAAANEFDWHIFPVVNPDGHQYSQEVERLWLKNRRRISANEFGVDLSKNWNSQWGISGGSFIPTASNYIGLGPFSELETRSVSRYIENIGTSLTGVISFRQFGQRLLIPFAHSSNPMYNYNDMLTIGRRAMGSMAVPYGTQYIVGTSRNVHDGSTGMLADWVKHRFNPPIVATYQLRDTGTRGYLLPVGQVKPSCEETFDSLMAILREAKFINVL